MKDSSNNIFLSDGKLGDSLKHGSLFSGIGGFDLASEWMGWENVFHCEIAEFPRKILHYYWPNSISYENIKETDFTIHRGRIEILTGGFPCQPFSMAGKRKGTEDERHLWPEMLRAIREIQPRWIVGENVFGLVNWDAGLVFEQVQSDLEAEGYEVQAFILPAAAVDAPHRRDRVWFVAYNNKFGCERYAEQIRDRRDSQEQIGCIDICEKQGWDEIHCLNEGSSKNRRNVADTNNNGLNKCDCQYEIDASKGGKYAQCNIKSRNGNGDVADTSSRRISRYRGETQRKSLQTTEFNENDCKFNRPVDWRNFPTQSPICGGNDGIPDRLDDITFPKWRNESIKGYGNAIVPQVVFQIFKAIEAWEEKNIITGDMDEPIQKTGT